MKDWIDRYGPWIVLFAASAAYYPRFSKTEAGLALYVRAAQCLLDSQDLPTCSPPFTYPPAFAFLMIPLAPLPHWLSLLAWYLITIAATVVTFRLSERIGARMFSMSFARSEVVWVRTIAIILTIKFVLAVVENQAYDALSTVIILIGLNELADRRELSGGAALGFAAAIKATPLIFLPYLLFRKRFAAAVAFVVVLLLASVAPDLVFKPAGEGYFQTWLRQIAGASLLDSHAVQMNFWSGANPLNHSLHGAVALRIDEVAEAGRFKAVLYALALALLAWTGALIAFRKQHQDLLALDASLLMLCMLMLSPMTSRSHYFLLILPYTALTMVMLRDRVTRGVGIAVIGFSFLFLTATSNDMVGKAMTNIAYRNSFLVIGALSLLIYISAVVWNPAVLRDARRFVWRARKPSHSVLER